MSNTVKYNGYIGSVEINFEDNTLHGKLLFIDDLVTYEASSPAELEIEFKNAVDDYIETCNELNRAPFKPLNGTFNIRIGEDLHRRAAMRAVEEDISLNDLIKKSIAEYLVTKSKIIEHHEHHEHHYHLQSENKITQLPNRASKLGDMKWALQTNISTKHH